MGETSGSQTISGELERIATLARQMKGVAPTTLARNRDETSALRPSRAARCWVATARARSASRWLEPSR